MQSSFPESDRGIKWLRATYLAFYCAALPLVLLALLFLYVTWTTWPLSKIGPVEGPEPTDAELIAFIIALGLFVLGYILVYFHAPRIARARVAWLPFAIQVPALVWLLTLRLNWSCD